MFYGQERSFTTTDTTAILSVFDELAYFLTVIKVRLGNRGEPLDILQHVLFTGLMPFLSTKQHQSIKVPHVKLIRVKHST